MTSESLSASADDFFRIAEELVMLTRDEALIVAEAVKNSGSSPEQVALQKGYLDAAQIDIIETLLHPRETVPGYEILDVLGQGGMGVVYRARQLNLNRIVALKTILLSRMADKSAAGRFEQEAQTVGRLRHPNIIAAYDFGRHEGRLFLAMELVEGQDVDSLLRDRGRLNEATAWGLARQAAAGLAHADHLGVVHRDVKPANLLLVEPPEGFSLPDGLQMVKIADFGLAFLADDQQVHTRLTSDNSAVGSPHYMAPEQLTDMDVDFRADIYALGATVYHMLAGRPPFGGMNLSQIIAQKLSGEFQPLSVRCPEISPASCHLVKRMLARDPKERPDDYESLMHEIQQLGDASDKTSTMLPVAASLDETGKITDVVSTHDTQSIPPGRQPADAPALPAPPGRRRLLMLCAAVVALLGIAGIGAWQLRPAPSVAVAPERVPMQADGSVRPLFNGRSTHGWGHVGNWVAAEDDEQAKVLEGTDCVAMYQLVKRGDDDQPVPLAFYRLTLFVNPHRATAVEVHFGIAQGPTPDGPQYVLRLDENKVTLGERASGDAEIKPVSELPPDEIAFPGRHAVQVERLPTGWFLTLDGHDLSGLPPRQDGELPVFRLAAEGGPAWFSDIFVEELQPVQPSGAG